MITIENGKVKILPLKNKAMYVYYPVLIGDDIIFDFANSIHMYSLDDEKLAFINKLIFHEITFSIAYGDKEYIIYGGKYIKVVDGYVQISTLKAYVSQYTKKESFKQMQLMDAI